jgi:hypothetical protein
MRSCVKDKDRARLLLFCHANGEIALAINTFASAPVILADERFAGGCALKKSMRICAAVAFAGSMAGLGHEALAQDANSVTVGSTIVTVGGGFQALQLPDMNFTFLIGPNGNTVRKQTNDSFDETGGVISGSIETPFGHLGSTPVTGVISGFFANVSDGDTRRCVSGANQTCTVESIVNTAGSDSATFASFTTKTDRDVDFWGANGELRFGQAPAPLPDSGGYLFRFGYVGIGADVRGIDQDNRLRLSSGGVGQAVKYTETLDTTYSGGFLSIGGEYNVLGYLGMGSNWGLRSFITLKGGVYNADTDYDGKFTPAGLASTKLGLSNEEVAFIGGLSFETRKQFGARTSLSLLTNYEWFSYAPQMKYLDADPPFIGKVSSTHIGDDDAFAVRSQLRLNIGLGSQQLYQEPLK